MGEVFLERFPLFVSLMESVFIGLLCYHDTGLNSPFRWYYLLSVICCSIRYRSVVAWWTVAFHTLSLLCLAHVLGRGSIWGSSLPLTITIMVWVTWASSSLAGSLHDAGQELERLNAELAKARAELNSASRSVPKTCGLRRRG